MTNAEPQPGVRFGVVILAAGASRRMGKPKLLLPWGGSSVLGHLFHLWQGIGARQIAAVVAADDGKIAAEMDRLGFPERNRIGNPTPERGMFSSIRCAARWNGWDCSLTHFAIVLGDQPHLSDLTLRTLCAFACEHGDRICQPARCGRSGHPVIMPAAAFRQLAASPVENLRHFLRINALCVKVCEIDDPGLDFDMDEPADYERARKLCFGPDK
jgi:molybdenum cofactor cytidylyltransferase